MVGRDWLLAAVVVALLGTATVVGQIVRRQPHLGLNAAAVATFNRRVRVWWIFYALLLVAFFSPTLTVAIFGLMSFEALREFITLTPTRRADHRALFWTLIFFTPMQYIFVAYDLYGLYSIFIPVYAFLFIPARVAMAGDFKRFLERVAKIQSGLLICVYCLSFAPALLYLDIPNATPSAKARLLFFFVTMALLSEAFQFIWSQLYGRHVIAPTINETRSLGRARRRLGEYGTRRDGPVLGDALRANLAICVYGDGCRGDGLCRRHDDVSDQARPWCSRLRHTR